MAIWRAALDAASADQNQTDTNTRTAVEAKDNEPAPEPPPQPETIPAKRHPNIVNAIQVHRSECRIAETPSTEVLGSQLLDNG